MRELAQNALGGGWASKLTASAGGGSDPPQAHVPSAGGGSEPPPSLDATVWGGGGGVADSRGRAALAGHQGKRKEWGGRIFRGAAGDFFGERRGKNGHFPLIKVRRVHAHHSASLLCPPHTHTHYTNTPLLPLVPACGMRLQCSGCVAVNLQDEALTGSTKRKGDD